MFHEEDIIPKDEGSMVEDISVLESSCQYFHSQGLFFPTGQLPIASGFPPLVERPEKASISILRYGNQLVAEHVGCNTIAVTSNSVFSHTFNIFNYLAFDITINQCNRVNCDKNCKAYFNLAAKSDGSVAFGDLEPVENRADEIRTFNAWDYFSPAENTCCLRHVSSDEEYGALNVTIRDRYPLDSQYCLEPFKFPSSNSDTFSPCKTS